MARVGQTEEIEVEWHPFELRPEGTPPIDPNAPYIENGWKYSITPMAKELGVEMHRPSVHPRTRLAHEASEFALSIGKQKPFADALFKAYWQKGRDIGEVEVLCDVALSVGIDPVAMRRCLEERTMQEAVSAKLAQAQAYNITAVPSFVIGNRYLMRGLVPESELKRVIGMVKGEGLIQLD